MRTVAIGLVAAGALLWAPDAMAQESADTPPPVNVIEVSGLVDEIVVDFVSGAIIGAERDGAQALVIQMNTKDAVVDDHVMADLVRAIADSPVPVGIWVGPSGARAYGAPGQLLAGAAATGLAKGARIGNLGEPVADDIDGLDTFTLALGYETVGYEEALEQDLLKLGPEGRPAPTLGEFIAGLDGLEYRGTTLETAQVVTGEDGPQLQPSAVPRFFKLPLTDQLMHTVASPPVAYLLFVAGLLLLVFEFYTAGIGLAGVIGAICLVLACYGIDVLPQRNWAVALLILSTVAFAVDVQTGVPRFWTGVGLLSYVVGSVWLWDGVSTSWVSLAAGIIGMLLVVFTGMPSMVRTRFATPTIGRDWLVGEMGEAVTAVSPDGTVRVRGALWRAHTNRATPVDAGGEVRVVAIDGTILEIEPAAGGARDYRERRAKH